MEFFDYLCITISKGMKTKFNQKTIDFLEEIITNQIGDISYIKKMYSEPHRFYHNWNHILNMIYEANTSLLTDDLLLAIVFHDIIYNPLRSDNEEKSAEFFKTLYDNREVYDAILDTKNHIGISDLSKKLNKLDLSILYGSFEDFMEYEDNIFKEFQFVDIKTYKEKRIAFLLSNFPDIKKEFIDYIQYKKYNIGVYAGSFNPFHKGHYDILKKGEDIFDKVIIARGVNPNKTNELCELPNILNYRQVEKYTGLLTDFINSLGYDVTLIRGLRNATDLEYEKTQYRYLKDLKPDIKVINILSDVEFEHISSSSIRMLKQYGRGDNYLV